MYINPIKGHYDTFAYKFILKMKVQTILYTWLWYLVIYNFFLMFLLQFKTIIIVNW